MQTIVTGHRNSDMDSICSAIAYAELKRLGGQPDVLAALAGATNKRIDYVLRRFGFEAPVLAERLEMLAHHIVRGRKFRRQRLAQDECRACEEGQMREEFPHGMSWNLVGGCPALHLFSV